MEALLTMRQMPPAAGGPADLLSRVGGNVWIAAVVRDFYATLAADPEIAWALREANVAALERRQVAFFVEALGGTPVPSPDDEELDLSPRLFARAVGHLGDALIARGLSDELLHEVVAAVMIHAVR